MGTLFRILLKSFERCALQSYGLVQSKAEYKVLGKSGWDGKRRIDRSRFIVNHHPLGPMFVAKFDLWIESFAGPSGAEYQF
uniref:Uncharacterized protein n=1 Tax=Romanomermis culicivorax TaxID=13658 RepID=A0A915JMA7_ROMCU